MTEFQEKLEKAAETALDCSIEILTAHSRLHPGEYRWNVDDRLEAAKVIAIMVSGARPERNE
jgi:hypothetical protein